MNKSRAIKYLVSLMLFVCTGMPLQAGSDDTSPDNAALEMEDYHKIQELFSLRKFKEAEPLLVSIIDQIRENNKPKDQLEIKLLLAKAIMHQWRTDEALIIYQEVADDSKAAGLEDIYSNALQALSTIYSFKGDKSKYKSLTITGLKLANIPPEDRSNFHLDYGDILMREGNIDSALYHGKIAYNIDLELNDSISLPRTCQSMGLTYFKNREYDKALKILLEGKTYLADDQSYKHAYFNLDICEVMLEIGNMDKARYYIEEAVRIAIENDLKSMRAKMYTRLAYVEELEENTDVALVHYSEALSTGKEIKKPELIQEATLGIVGCKLKLGNDVSEDDLKELFALKKETGSASLNNRIDLYYLIYLIKSGADKSIISKNISSLDSRLKDDNNIYHLKNFAKIKYDYYSDNKNYNAAITALEEYVAIKDKISTDRQEFRILDLEAKYDKSEKQKQIIALGKENEAKSEILKQQKRAIIIGGIGLGIISILSFLLYTFYKKVSEQNVVVSKALKEKDFLLREIHHRVKNNLQVISSLLSLQARQIEDVDIQKAIHEGRDRVRSMALIHQNLYQNDNLSGVSVRHYLTKLGHELFSTYNVNEDRIKLTVDIEDMELDVDTMVPFGLIINELVSNCLKHAFPGDTQGNILIKMEEDDGLLLLSVSDDGIGIDKEKMASSRSFGNRLIKAFSSKLHAEVEVLEHNGTTVNLKIKNFKKAS